MRFKIGLLFLLACCSSGFAQLQSPDEFLGYELGTKFTPHYKIVNYFNHAAVAVPGMMYPIAINRMQPKLALIQVLFEPRSRMDI